MRTLTVFCITPHPPPLARRHRPGARTTHVNRHTVSHGRKAKLEFGTVPRHGGRVRGRGPGPYGTDAVVEVLGGTVRHDLDTVEPGGTGLGPHVFDEQPPDPTSLCFVGDEQQIELRWSEDERVEPEHPAFMFVGAHGYEGAVGFDVIRTDPVARHRGRVFPLVGA
jgi:hypothetical protein